MIRLSKSKEEVETDKQKAKNLYLSTLRAYKDKNK